MPQDEFGRWRILAMAALVLVLSVCGREEGTEPSVAPDTVVRRDTLPTSSAVAGRPHVECEGLETSILVAPATRADLRREFGAPDSTISRTEPNRHVPGAIDSLFSVYYRGLIVRIRKPPEARDLPERVQITETGYLRHPELGIGAESSRIIEVLGEPTERSDSRIVYDCGIGAEQPVSFHLRNGVVESIEIAYYVD